VTERQIRAADVGDAPAVAGLLGELGYPTTPEQAAVRLRAALSDDRDAVLVCALDGRVVGLIASQIFTLLYRPRPQCRITALVVNGATRRRGVARALVEAVEARATQAGCFRIELTTRPGRPEALSFYAALGYAERPARLVKQLEP
jgi:ribosomal protein S18 acetylase RimI-like enzyme